MKNLLKNHNFYLVLWILAINLVISCSAPDASETPRSKDSSNSSPKIDAGTAAPTTPLATTCWEKVFSSPAVLACSGLYLFSSKTCVPGFTRDATCTRATVAATYQNATVNGQPMMTMVDGWIADGYEPNQCAKGSDGKLYAYFVKKIFTETPPTVETTPASTPSTPTDPAATPKSTAAAGTYSIADKKLGPPGAVFNSIVLSTQGTLDPFTCD